MKSADELHLPTDIRYSKNHEWARREEDQIRVGIDDYAQDQLGDVVFVELPEVGAALAQGEVFGTVESVKAVSEIFMPVGGEIMGVNAALSDAPELVNESPYEEAWMIVVKPDDAHAFDGLMDQEAYLKMLKEGK